jgi:hypothetical protein
MPAQVVAAGRADLVPALIEAGVQLMVVDAKGNTPLHLAGCLRDTGAALEILGALLRAHPGLLQAPNNKGALPAKAATNPDVRMPKLAVHAFVSLFAPPVPMRAAPSVLECVCSHKLQAAVMLLIEDGPRSAEHVLIIYRLLLRSFCSVRG